MAIVRAGEALRSRLNKYISSHKRRAVIITQPLKPGLILIAGIQTSRYLHLQSSNIPLHHLQSTNCSTLQFLIHHHHVPQSKHRHCRTPRRRARKSTPSTFPQANDMQTNKSKFLDFAALPSYTRFFESITSPRPGMELSKGDVVTVQLANSPTFKPVIQVRLLKPPHPPPPKKRAPEKSLPI